jgi:hypothetical protein
MNDPGTRDAAKVMRRSDLTRRLVARLKHEEAVIGGIGYANFDLWGAGQRPQNFYMLGSMGLACPIALGVALAQPKRKVFALEGGRVEWASATSGGPSDAGQTVWPASLSRRPSVNNLCCGFTRGGCRVRAFGEG